MVYLPYFFWLCYPNYTYFFIWPKLTAVVGVVFVYLLSDGSSDCKFFFICLFVLFTSITSVSLHIGGTSRGHKKILTVVKMLIFFSLQRHQLQEYDDVTIHLWLHWILWRLFYICTRDICIKAHQTLVPSPLRVPTRNMETLYNIAHVCVYVFIPAPMARP
jgi:hypothetical protein